jgi:hypothetical protein
MDEASHRGIPIVAIERRHALGTYSHSNEEFYSETASGPDSPKKDSHQTLICVESECEGH